MNLYGNATTFFQIIILSFLNGCSSVSCNRFWIYFILILFYLEKCCTYLHLNKWTKLSINYKKYFCQNDNPRLDIAWNETLFFGTILTLSVVDGHLRTCEMNELENNEFCCLFYKHFYWHYFTPHSIILLEKQVYSEIPKFPISEQNT